MGRQIKNDFVVDTIGHCFICLVELTLPSLQVKPEQDSSSSGPFSTHSLHHLSRYLKVKISKVFHDSENDSIPKHLLDKVERSTLKVSLCEQCARWNAKLSQLFQQLEKIEVEVASYLELIHSQALDADDNGRSEVFRKSEDCDSADGLTRSLKLEIAETMRREAMQKCVHKLNEVQPQIKIQKLTEKEGLSRTNRCKTWISQGNKLTQSHRATIPEPTTELKDDIIKLEFENETPNDIGNDDFEVFDHARDQYDHDPEQPHFQTSTEDLDPGQCPSIRPTDYQQHIRNSKTGRLACKLCSKDFADKLGFHKHYQSTHLKIRFQCKICNKLFTQKINLKTHQQTVHLKQQRFQCQICNKAFTQKHRLQTHQKSVHNKQTVK